MYNDTITLFNRYESKLGDMWYPTVIHGVNLNIDKAAIVAKMGAESGDSAILNIRYTHDGEGNKMVGEKQWKPPKEWDRQTNDMLPETLTFTAGTNFDFFYVGEWPDDAPISDEDERYMPDGFYNYMNKWYDYVFAITSVAEYSVIPHFEVMAK